MHRILIVEDDEVIFEELKKLLARNGYETLDGRDNDNLARDFDCAVLDVGLPGRSGYEICAQIRETKKCPVIFLTSMDKPENELMGFVVGGDDYIRKPFNTAVLLARIARFLKSKAQEDNIIKGSLCLDTVKMEVKNGEKRIPLSKTEFMVLKILAESNGIIAQKKIIEKLWDDEAYIDENTLYVNINRLREKLKDIGLDGVIKTMRGAGYWLGES